ncbi:1 TM domain-containing transmembrane protein [Acrasis kona]|uniref:1 TM domain-containing transmembrane protein n=1 Tax=Acrasis kona TaxID=1008807 RepID=A0AAW2ZBC2_9EUKA
MLKALPRARCFLRPTRFSIMSTRYSTSVEPHKKQIIHSEPRSLVYHPKNDKPLSFVTLDNMWDSIKLTTAIVLILLLSLGRILALYLNQEDDETFLTSVEDNLLNFEQIGVRCKSILDKVIASTSKEANDIKSLLFVKDPSISCQVNKSVVKTRRKRILFASVCKVQDRVAKIANCETYPHYYRGVVEYYYAVTTPKGDCVLKGVFVTGERSADNTLPVELARVELCPVDFVTESDQREPSFEDTWSRFVESYSKDPKDYFDVTEDAKTEIRKLFIDAKGEARTITPIPNFKEAITLYTPSEPLFDVVELNTLLFKTTKEDQSFLASIVK